MHGHDDLHVVLTSDVQAEGAAAGLNAMPSELARDVRAQAEEQVARGGGGELEAAAHLRATYLAAIAERPRETGQLLLLDFQAMSHTQHFLIVIPYDPHIILKMCDEVD